MREKPSAWTAHGMRRSDLAAQGSLFFAAIGPELCALFAVRAEAVIAEGAFPGADRGKLCIGHSVPSVSYMLQVLVISRIPPASR